MIAFRGKYILIVLVCSLINTAVFSQIRLGEWRTHLPYLYGQLVTVTSDRVFCSSTGGLFYYNLEDRSLNTLSKIDGLSDNGVSAMNWNEDHDIFMLAYGNANLDIIDNGQIINIPDIMKKQISGDKSIYDIYFIDNLAYLSTGFGIVVINLEKYEVKDTYIIGDNGNTLKVYQTTTDGQYIYAATASGIRRALLSDPFLVDFNSWEKLADVPNANGEFSCITDFNGYLFAATIGQSEADDEVYYLDNGIWKEFLYFTGSECNELRSTKGRLLICDEGKVSIVSNDLLIIRQYATGHPRSAGIDNEDNVWIADYGKGLLSTEGGNISGVNPNGPVSSSVFHMASSGGVLYSVPGGISVSWNNLFKTALVESFSDQEWNSSYNWDYRDLIRITVDPTDPGHVFAASWGYGLLEYRDMEFQNRYGEANSSLQSIIPGGDFVRLGGLAFDKGQNLWMTNSNVSEPISVLKNDGTWKSFNVNNLLTGFSALGDLIVTQYGHKWIIIPRGHGLFAMNDNGTIDDTSDDEYKMVSVVDRNGKVITNEVFSFAEDRNGNIWLGTNRGILVFYSPYRLFTDGSIYAQEIIVPRNDGTIYGDPLLETEKVTAIEVDGANRKWLGTEGSGIFLVSEDGMEQIYNFNVSNSPLISNSITDICINDQTGEVFIGTDKGIISFMGEATGGSANYSDVVVYPNPVRETYEGMVIIKGLVENTTVKITDISGNLVYETESLGGQALWDGKNFRGDRVATGVYMIYLSSSNGEMSYVTKVLFIH